MNSYSQKYEMKKNVKQYDQGKVKRLENMFIYKILLQYSFLIY